MEKEEIARAMPRIRQAFEVFKQSVGEGRMAQAGATLFGDCLEWGLRLKDIYAAHGRDDLLAADCLTRFFVTRFRGMETPADLSRAPADALFLMAYTAFPYLDAMLDELTIGDHHGFDDGGHWLVRRVMAGEDEGEILAVRQDTLGWRFDLMPLFRAKAHAMEQFVATQFDGDFDAFLWRYVADHDLIFDIQQSWRPLV